MTLVNTWLLLLITMSMTFYCSSSRALGGDPLVPGMFVFGDSLVDNGNNNFLNSIAKSNYIPYGIDFNGVPTGRFCNGKTMVDMLGEMLGLPYIPAYADPTTAGAKILGGVNYASAAAGILEETGQHYGERYSLNQQVLNFEGTLYQLRTQMSARNLTQCLAKSIAVMVFGSNDYINNYLLPSLYPTSHKYNPVEFANLLLNHYTRQILALYNVGLRKFLLAGIGPLGCIPNQLATGEAPPGSCVSYANEILEKFNVGLRSVVNQLNSNHTGAIFVYGNTYGAMVDILNNATAYGFYVIDRGCCGLGRNQAQMTCLPLSIPCPNRNQFIFWDAFHPTQAVNTILSQRAFSGPPSDCYPINIQQMAQI
ncbi:GDSL esterase/lipase At1g71250-like isoform X1 [Macadamia integrifolia]|uniref:GDSL esterase/lipase At1g71250-like isoform X1 n=1 Tax=Macadamia integrifolia TaxID=60698 RepID=UPI001C5003F0|nr:GDSL esterase/lipase At1g71250-like isoform X1 [Macadamia integrifolia]